ncbi:hypothetical protein NO1_0186 [Candidatus Termititenax aidoneus]|uniref:Uncharacterized protein n=1 Tax=Termititenax aidoneus TaxID=2218524 RepID=A0A388T8K5_TERA1|nr:hypothetical protein NO1_0186 [Candidatus Termititenax aidoneus]
MGRGWQTNIGGELYINEVRTFAVGGPIYPAIGEANVVSTIVRTFTFQTADGQRGDFYDENEEETTLSLGAGILTSIGKDYNLLTYYRDQLEGENKLSPPGRFVGPADKRQKMKLEVVNEGHYIVYGPNGMKYHFRLEIFEKNANWQKEWKKRLSVCADEDVYGDRIQDQSVLSNGDRGCE